MFLCYYYTGMGLVLSMLDIYLNRYHMSNLTSGQGGIGMLKNKLSTLFYGVMILVSSPDYSVAIGL